LKKAPTNPPYFAAPTHVAARFGAAAHLTAVFIISTLVLTVPVGCEQKMAQQPSYRPLEPSRFFEDGRASRPLVQGTVQRGTTNISPALTSGRKPIAGGVGQQSAAPTISAGTANLTQGIRPDDFVSEFPFPITRDVLIRGQQRYTIYCAICHDDHGTGNGKIVQRGFTHPPSYLTDNSRQLAHNGYEMPLREVPVGYLFDVATNGFGAMADYSSQVPPRDRWAIAAYVRTLQLSYNIRLNDLPPQLREEAQKSLEATP
jgi:hypothetical protein